MSIAAVILLVLSPMQDSAKDVLRVQVRVRDADGARVPGAEVFFAAADLAGVDRRRAPETLHFACDDRGNLVARLPAGRTWGAWAVHDEGRRRLASAWTEEGVGSGQIELVVEPFPVPFVRLQNTAGWRARFGDELVMSYVSRSGPAPRFELPFPEHDGAIQRIPPLPHDSYFPVVLHRRLGLLDTAYLAPHFHQSEPNAEPLYERDYPLKRCILGAPVRVHGRVTDAEGVPVTGALVEAGPAGGMPLALRQRTTSDALGAYELWIPWKPEQLRTRYESEAIVLAEGRAPLRIAIDGIDRWLAERPVTRADGVGSVDSAGPLLDVELSAHASSRWVAPFFDPGRGDRIVLRTPVRDRDGSDQIEVLELEVGDDGAIQLPRAAGADTQPAKPGEAHPRFGAPLQGRFDLVLIRDGRPVRLYSRASGRLPQQLVLPEPRPVTLTALRVHGQPMPGGRLELRPLGGDPDPLVFQLDREGRADLTLVPGEYYAALRHERLGEGWARVHVPSRGDEQVAPVRIRCLPYLRRQARVDCEDQAQLKVQLGLRVLDYAETLPRELQAWVREGLSRGVLPVDVPIGRRFTLRLSPYIAGFELSALGRSELGWMRAQESAAIGEGRELRLDLH